MLRVRGRRVDVWARGVQRTRAWPRAAAWLTAPGFHLTLAVLAGAVLRFWGILHCLGEGYIYHPDGSAMARAGRPTCVGFERVRST